MSTAPTRHPSLFRSGLGPRFGAAALYGLLAFGAVALLEPAGAARPRAVPATMPSTPATAQRARLCLESLQAVGSWEVRVDGAPVAARRSDATTWIADFALGPDAALVVDATPAGAVADVRNVIRIRIAGTATSRDQSFWCEREWSVATRTGQLAAAPAPLDPEDLP